MVGGFIGEAWNLTLTEWMRYHEAVADANAGRMKISTIILDPSARQALEKIEFTRTLGFEVAEVMNPAVQLKSDDEIFAFYQVPHRSQRHGDRAVPHAGVGHGAES